jgi:hypothetical protein
MLQDLVLSSDELVAITLHKLDWSVPLASAKAVLRRTERDTMFVELSTGQVHWRGPSFSVYLRDQKVGIEAVKYRVLYVRLEPGNQVVIVMTDTDSDKE